MIVMFAWPVIRDLWEFDQRSQSADVPLVIPQVAGPDRAVDHGLLVVIRLITGGDRDAAGKPGH